MIPSAHFASRGVNLEIVGNLELLEVNDPPKALPGATVQRSWTPDDRLVMRDAKDSDLVCFYESVAAVRHKKTMAIYVIFRETIDALMSQQKDRTLYPKWLMDHSAKRAERQFYISRAVAWVRELAAINRSDKVCFQQWPALLTGQKLLRQGTSSCRLDG
jgi:hypothetical protein